MTKTFCDRCEAETTGIKSGHVVGIPDADESGNGDVQHQADLCDACYHEWRNWLKQPPAKRKRPRPTPDVIAPADPLKREHDGTP